MDGTIAQYKVYKGYGKAADKIGLPYKVYRSANGLSPISPANYLYDLNLSPTQTWTYMSPNKFTASTWMMVIDGTQVEIGDFLVGTEHTFYIAGKQHLLPILGVECDRKVTISIAEIPDILNQKGKIDYSAMDIPPENKTNIIENCPCSFLIGSKGERNDVDIPLDVKMPWYAVYVPYFSGVHIPVASFIDDEFGQRYQINGNQRTDIGWKLVAQTLGA